MTALLQFAGPFCFLSNQVLSSKLVCYEYSTFGADRGAAVFAANTTAQVAYIATVSGVKVTSEENRSCGRMFMVPESYRHFPRDHRRTQSYRL